MSRTDDFTIFDAAASELSAVMGAYIFNRIIPIGQFEHGDATTINFNVYGMSNRNFCCDSNVNPITQITTTSMLGSMVRAKLPIAESVPASELGQLPHAPK